MIVLVLHGSDMREIMQPEGNGKELHK